jgi:hypothetical protein
MAANQPHGLINGIGIAALIARIRWDFKILTRPLRTGIPKIAEFMIPVPFPHEANARRG